MKAKTGYTLSPENIENIRKAAADDDRSASQWLDRHMTEYFAENPVVGVGRRRRPPTSRARRPQ